MHPLTPLQLLAAALAETAQTAQEMCAAEIAIIEADQLARIAQTVAIMQSDRILTRGRVIRGGVSC